MAHRMKTGRRSAAQGTRAAPGTCPGAAPAILRRSSVILCAALGLPGAAWSQAMADPTRPPPGYAAGEADTGAAAGGPVLQSVMISPSGSAAIISGEMVRIGQKFGDSVLVKVAETEVVLRGAGGLQVLKLHPGVDKRPSVPPAQAVKPRRGKSGEARAGRAAPRQGER
ncbi:MAG: hypothetical protein IT529_04375 [Burkholderiales bacterium]|nr:hypothetical protein [Burkholderiales bacterium]